MKGIRRLAWASLVLGFGHIVFGAIVRITGSGMGCGDHWPKCHGYWFPPLDRMDLVIEVSHRYFAATLSAAIVALLVLAFARRRVPGVAGANGVLRPVALAALLVVAAALFGGVVVKLELPGQTLLAALTHAVSALPATSGRFPQVSGLKFDVDIHGTPPRVSNVLVNGQPLDPARTYTVAVPDYLYSGGDGFDMLPRAKALVSPAAGELVVGAVERYVASRKTVAPQTEGRITIIR